MAACGKKGWYIARIQFGGHVEAKFFDLSRSTYQSPENLVVEGDTVWAGDLRLLLERVAFLAL